MIPPFIKVEITRLKAERDDALELLTLCLPYVEDCAGDPAYKGDRVSELARRIRETVK